MQRIKALGLSAGIFALALTGIGLACSSPNADGAARRADGASRAVEGPAHGPCSLLLVTIDTWRWDYIGASGSGRVATPNLDRLAKEGVYEPEAETPCPLTTPAHATILTGLWPLHHGILDCISYSLPHSLPTLAEAFAAKGYCTAAFVSSLSLDRRFGLGRGFLTYDEGAMGAGAGAASRDGADTTRAVTSYLSAARPGLPLFLWVHYYDLHMPYRARPEYDARYPGNPYAAQAAFVDDQMGSLLQALQADPSRSWRIVVAGDHGEGLGDHHEAGHGMALYRSTLHVPLILFPRPEGPLIHLRPWRLEDLDPTLRAWFGLQTAQGADGQSLFGRGDDQRPLPSLTIQPAIEFGVNPCLGLRRGDWMYMRHGVEELYDLAADPGETKDLAALPAARARLEGLRKDCDAAVAPAELAKVAQPTARPSSADLTALQGLGYVGGFVFNPASLQPADIRKVCDDEAALEQAKERFRKDGNLDAVKRAYGEVLSNYPKAAALWQQFGLLLLGKSDMAGAARAFEHAVRENPKDTMSLVNLGGLELAAGRPDRAKVLFESALALDPGDLVAHKNLGTIYAQSPGGQPAAVAHYKRYLELGGDADAPLVREYLLKASGGGVRQP